MSLSNAIASTHHLPGGGGEFELPRLTVGVFLNDQVGHRIALGSDRRTHLPLVTGQGWILPQGASGLCEYDDPLTFVTFAFSEALLHDVGFRESRTFAPVVGELDPMLREFTYQAAALEDDGGGLYAETMNLAAAAHLHRVVSGEPQATRAIDDRRLRRALAYIHDNIDHELTLAAMASEAAMSRFHFARSFTRAVGISPLQYAIRHRVELAKVLLRTTDLPVHLVANRVGYDDASRFARHFARHAGMTPQAFRSA
jgi:AraC family transcriptional regulator